MLIFSERTPGSYELKSDWGHLPIGIQTKYADLPDMVQGTNKAFKHPFIVDRRYYGSQDRRACQAPASRLGSPTPRRVPAAGISPAYLSFAIGVM